MTAAYPIPEAALDDRLACVGTSGSGKTYAMGTAVEKLLHRKARAVIADPLGVWWGLRLRDDETPSRFNVVIFGGPHGDLPLTEHAGAVIGEAAATMAESCILDLSELGTKAAERRFMLAFLTALYRKATGEPVHLILDEADMWAPQQLRDKEGEAAKLLGMMETIVRRGRIKGFIPWMITQRPAVLNKDVLSQVDGVIAMKLVATQDRNALDEWIAGSADKAEAARIKGDMPGLQLGQAIVWLPGRGVLHTAQFPKKVTFDSSRTPKRGEVKRTLSLKPLDVGALKDRLSSVEAEVAAADPRKLKARIAELERAAAIASKIGKPIAESVVADVTARAEAKLVAEFKRGESFGFIAGRVAGRLAMIEAVRVQVGVLDVALQKLCEQAEAERDKQATISPPPKRHPLNGVVTPSAKPVAASTPPSDIGGPQQRILASLRFWDRLGFDQPSNEQVAAAAGYSATSTSYTNPRGALKSADLIHYPAPGLVALTTAGETAAPPPPSGTARELMARVLSGPEARILDALPQDGSPLSNEDLAAAAGYSATSTSYTNPRGGLKTKGAIRYPSPGMVAVEPWVWA